MQKYVQKPAQENNRCRTVELWGWIVINPVPGQLVSFQLHQMSKRPRLQITKILKT